MVGRALVAITSIACLALCACDDSGGTPSVDAGPDAPPTDLAPGPDGPGAGDAVADAVTDSVVGDVAGQEGGAADASPDAAKGLPFSYTRPPKGTPVTPAELKAITDTYIDLLKKTRYFDLLEERNHGWPESDPQQRYWYGTWWSGVVISKSGGNVTYAHTKGGGDNNGLRSGPILEGLCFAQKLWGTPKLEHVTREMIRGFNSWILAMERQPNDPAGTILTRASYPASITSTDHGRTVQIDYSLNHPGDDNSATEYVHNPQNPYWGDIWVKNKRSKDCIGHMLRAIASLDDCASTFGADAKQDTSEMLANYVSWCKKVEADGWVIATYDKNLQVWLPPITETLAHFIGVGNAECNAMIAVRLNGHGNPGTFNCGNGIHPLEWIVLQNDHNGEIVRSFHEAAAKHALRANQPAVAQAMLPGLALRIEEGLNYATSGNWPVSMEEDDLWDLMLHSANTGVPLTWEEVRWLHKQIEKAHASYTSANPAQYKVFDPSTPDGTYVFTPNAAGIKFRSLALALGTCVATYLNPTTNPVLDCAYLKSAWTP
jgi:hypothetical protein